MFLHFVVSIAYVYHLWPTEIDDMILEVIRWILSEFFSFESCKFDHNQ